MSTSAGLFLVILQKLRMYIFLKISIKLIYCNDKLQWQNVNSGYLNHIRIYVGKRVDNYDFILFYVAPGPVSDVTVRDESVTSSELTLTWMEISSTNSEFSHYTVFYLPVSGPYGPIMASNRRKRQSVQAGELTMNFTRANGSLTDLYGAVTYRIQVAAVIMFNEQVATGDRSAAIEITTLEGGNQICVDTCI